MKTQPIQIENTQFNHNFDLEAWTIDHVFKDTIWAEFIDESNGDKVTRNGLIVPQSAQSLKDFFRIARVLGYGPDCSECIVEGVYLLVPPNIGVQGMQKGPNGGKSVFLKETSIMAVISPKTEEAVSDKENTF